MHETVPKFGEDDSTLPPNLEPLEETKLKKKKPHAKKEKDHETEGIHPIEEFKPVHEKVPKFGEDDSTLPPNLEPIEKHLPKK